jgi:putative MFS transporter
MINFRFAILVAALGYFVDVYDIILFTAVRIPSLKSLNVPADQVTSVGLFLLNVQLIGMVIGGFSWGVFGDKKGRLSTLFGSIILYSIANLMNSMVNSVEAYAVCRFLAGIGLAGELGSGITLVSEIMPREKRGYGTMIIATCGVLGGIAGGLSGDLFPWRTSYIVGGLLGLGLLF